MSDNKRGEIVEFVRVVALVTLVTLSSVGIGLWLATLSVQALEHSDR
ncbi:MAG: hypothetical protein ABL886_11740 [Rhodoglobus sp.]